MELTWLVGLLFLVIFSHVWGLQGWCNWLAFAWTPAGRLQPETCVSYQQDKVASRCAALAALGEVLPAGLTHDS